MISYTTRYLNIVSFIITIFVLIFITKSSLLFIYFNKFNFNQTPISNILKKDTIFIQFDSNDIKQDTKEEKNNHSQIETKENIKVEKNWRIIIPKISLDAEISEGTNKEVMDKYVGHFQETNIENGNVGLAAHNRGYPVNYFSKIKELRQGDEIIYKHNNFEKTYIVSQNLIITDEDWSYLEYSEENRITLITCVENEPQFRRCIQAIET